MGRRSATETAIAVVAAFIARNSWEQSALARRIGVATRTLRGCLDALDRAGVPLERFEESQRQIFWSVPKGWLPEAATLTGDDARACARLLARLSASTTRDRILEMLVGAAAISLARTEREPGSDVLAAVEDAVRDGAALGLLYDSANTGLRWRTLSPHRIAYGDRTRFVATCHERQELGWFRIDRVLQAQRSGDAYRPVDERALAAFLMTSASGFHRGEVVRCRFRVRAPEARWVRGVLPISDARISEHASGAIDVEVHSAGLDVLARFVAGLGDAATAKTPELRERVKEIAAGALRMNGELRKGRPAEKRRSARGGGDDWTE